MEASAGKLIGALTAPRVTAADVSSFGVESGGSPTVTIALNDVQLHAQVAISSLAIAVLGGKVIGPSSQIWRDRVEVAIHTYPCLGDIHVKLQGAAKQVEGGPRVDPGSASDGPAPVLEYSAAVVVVEAEVCRCWAIERRRTSTRWKVGGHSGGRQWRR